MEIYFSLTWCQFIWKPYFFVWTDHGTRIRSREYFYGFMHRTQPNTERVKRSIEEG